MTEPVEGFCPFSSPFQRPVISPADLFNMTIPTVRVGLIVFFLPPPLFWILFATSVPVFRLHGGPYLVPKPPGLCCWNPRLLFPPVLSQQNRRFFCGRRCVSFTLDFSYPILRAMLVRPFSVLCACLTPLPGCPLKPQQVRFWTNVCMYRPTSLPCVFHCSDVL